MKPIKKLATSLFSPIGNLAEGVSKLFGQTPIARTDPVVPLITEKVGLKPVEPPPSPEPPPTPAEPAPPPAAIAPPAPPTPSSVEQQADEAIRRERRPRGRLGTLFSGSYLGEETNTRSLSKEKQAKKPRTLMS